MAPTAELRWALRYFYPESKVGRYEVLQQKWVQHHIPAGMTEDMIVFAKANYQAARNEYISTIKAAKTCEFTDEELAKFDIATLAKMAKLPSKLSEKDTALKADNSLIAPDHKAKGTGGSLPPPEM